MVDAGKNSSVDRPSRLRLVIGLLLLPGPWIGAALNQWLYHDRAYVLGFTYGAFSIAGEGFDIVIWFIAFISLCLGAALIVSWFARIPLRRQTADIANYHAPKPGD
jgi:hypothetical protein